MLRRLTVAVAVVAAVAVWCELADPRDHYEALRVRRGATKAEIRAAYKKRALALHPDKVAQGRSANPWFRLAARLSGGEARRARRWHLASDANEVLADAERRAAYDESLAAREAREALARRERRGGPRRFADAVDLSGLRVLLRAPANALFVACVGLIGWTYVAAPILRGLRAPFEAPAAAAAPALDDRRRAAVARAQAAADAAPPRPPPGRRRRP